MDLSYLNPQQPEGKLFDSACSAYVFEHIENPGPILDGIRRWLKPNACLLISVPHDYAYDDPDHVNHFFRRRYQKLLCEHVEAGRVDISAENEVLRGLCRPSLTKLVEKNDK